LLLTQIFIKDIGSSSGTFRNNERIPEPNKEFEVFSGDYIQLGRDFTGESNWDSEGRVEGTKSFMEVQKRCVRFQIVIVKPNEKASDAYPTEP
jgi:pSer/pThr/pTyr-binding forkhead associated (FHA) protein